MAVDLRELGYGLEVQVGADLQGELLWKQTQSIVAAGKDALDSTQHLFTKYTLYITLMCLGYKCMIVYQRGNCNTITWTSCSMLHAMIDAVCIL